MQEAETSQEEMDSLREEKETPQEEPETTEDEKVEPEESEETVEEKPEKSKELQSAIAQKKVYRDKLNKAEKELKELKKNPDIDLPTSVNPLEVVKLAKALEGYSTEEVSFVTRNANSNSIDDIIDATKDDWVKTAINSKREKVANEKGTPSPSSSSSRRLDKTQDELKEMPDKEYRAWLAKNLTKKTGTRGI